MISKRLLIISTVVMIKQKRFRSIEQIQSRHEIVDIEVQLHKDETIDNDIKNERSTFLRSLKENKLFHDQRFFYSIILSFASENVSSFLIFHFHANERIHYHSFKT